MSFVSVGAALTSLLGSAGAVGASTAAASAIPAGMATAGGMASGVGAAGAAGAGAAGAGALGAGAMNPLMNAMLMSGAKTAGPMMAQKLLGGGSKPSMAPPMRSPGGPGAMFRPFDPSQLASSTAGIDQQRLQRLAQILQSQGRLR